MTCRGAVRTKLRERIGMAAVDERIDIDGVQAHRRISIGDLAHA
jgi:hypothetical protein